MCLDALGTAVTPRAPGPGSEAPSGPTLTIGELAERTGVPVGTLRTWESRYGTPRSSRLPSGHRRYAEADVFVVNEICRLRAAGLALPVAVAHVGRAGAAPAPSVFADMARRHPGIPAQPLRKRGVLALTRAMEDASSAQAERPVLFGGFQREEHYRESQQRWEELARTSHTACVFADFPSHSTITARPMRLALPASSPVRREWLLVCDDDVYPACLVATERPGQHPLRDGDRTFDTMWSVDPPVVRDAARACAGLAVSLEPRLQSAFGERLAGRPPAASPDLGRVHRLLDRVVGYLDQR